MCSSSSGSSGWDEKNRESHIRAYFSSNLFPARQIWAYFVRNAGQNCSPQQREFAFEFAGGVLQRHLCYSSCEQFVEDVVRRAPRAIHVGPVYTTPPSLKCLGHCLPLRRELVIDMDVSDYDDVRTCACVGSKSMCTSCWGYIVAGVQLLQSLLTHCFGFRQLLWVFSGRRGVHCWISDATAMTLTDDQRAALAQQLSPWTRTIGGQLRPNPSYLASAFYRNTLFSLGLKAFGHYIVMQQSLFNTAEYRASIANRFVRATAGDAAADELIATPLDSYSDLMRLLMRHVDKQQGLTIVHQLIFVYTFPRLDVAVTQKRIHLLKMPYGIHASTGAICQALEVQQLPAFRGSATVSQLFSRSAAASSGTQQQPVLPPALLAAAVDGRQPPSTN